ncbi:hydroxypyruvate isomerase family protein [Yinghuangia seranimata]|uniref:hydroxypyruvate isomerase family protein n=1 Tax=Yinghuangia seranimata TaxID=408067 RepID=UPI00248CCCE3|nr:TIM barrel protein [Yinghuangia seranimata]MDI2131517.1 TIM barrel protein [Yinghuangia seranimata]
MSAALRFDVNLSILFTELPLLERFDAAAQAGFTEVELWWPFDGPTPADADLDALERALGNAGVSLVGLNFDAGNMPGGDRGLVSRPADSDRFRANIDVAVGFAARVGCRVLNALYGNRVDGVSRQEQAELGLANLALAAQAAHREGAVVLVEAVNTVENPLYQLDSAKAAVDVVDAVNAATGLGNTKFLCDLYHLATMGEDLPAVIDAYADRIGHVQIADSPGRGQPGTGDLDFDDLFGRLAAVGYDGRVGLEYKPVGPSADSFAWLPRDRRDGKGNA